MAGRPGYAARVSDSEIIPPASIRIAETPVGRGVFATVDIAKGETIEVAPIVGLDADDAGGTLMDYVVDDGEGGQALMLGYGSLYNHSDDPNAEYVVWSEGAYEFKATRDIAAAEEITITYGGDWWETREIEPLRG